MTSVLLQPSFFSALNAPHFVPTGSVHRLFPLPHAICSALLSHMFRYAKLLSVPPSTRDASAIDIDIPRTFKGDDLFSSRVNPESLRRVLYSYSSHCNEQGLGLSYIQGLNTICGMLLFNNSELNAFFCLCAFTLRFAPSHYEANIAGAHRVASCCDELLKHVDSEAIHFIALFRFFFNLLPSCS
jgi:hypothetical protein